jgi:Domain of unknown function (DUF5667)
MSQTHPQIDRLGVALCDAAPPLPRDFTQTVMAHVSAEVCPAERVADRVHRLAGRRWTLAGRRWRLAVVALVLSMPLGASVGAVRASATSLPGDPLYSVRGARESLALALTPDQTAHDALALAFAQERVADLQQALSRHAGRAVTRMVLQTLLTYDRLVPASHHLPGLSDALLSQYQAVQRAHQQVLATPAWPHDSAREPVAADLADASAAVRALARHHAAAWAQAGPDIPAQVAGRDTGP